MAPTLPRQLALAEKHFRGGNHEFAEKLLRDILARAPHNAKANELLGYIAGNRGDLDDSFELLKAATAAPGASGEAHYYLAKHFLERNFYEQAANACQEALRLNGNFFEALHDLGVALAGCGKTQSAIPAYDKALALRPDFAQGWFNKGVALDELKQFDRALQCYDKALALDPGYTAAWINRGATLNDLGRYAEALTSHDKAIALEPRRAQAWSNRGVTLAALKRYKEALDSHEKALSVDPEFAEAWGRGAGVLTVLKYPEKAVPYFAKALALTPDIPYLQGDWLRARMTLCQWTASGGDAPTAADYSRQCENLLASVDARQKVSEPFTLLAMPSTLAQQRACAEIYSIDRSPAVSKDTPFPKRNPNGRIRVGYFSPDFRSHAVSFLTAGLYEYHDRSRFEIHAFSFAEPDGDAMTTRLKAAFDHFHDVETLTDDDVTALARRLGIDIAVDLAGHTQGARTGIFARRAAPIQVSYLGYPGSMGAPFIDYIFADNRVIPERDADAYSEKVAFLPHGFQVNDSERAIGPVPARAACGLADDAFVFCCFNNGYKINPRMFDIWLALLLRAEHSVLWLIGEHDAQMQNLRAWAAARGVPPHRLVFAGRVPYAEHLARYALADLVLDTLPFNGGTTTSDALWGGAPVLTCTGATFAGRMATSLLHNIGLPELVTPTLDEYQAKALHLAHHPAEVAALKQKVAANRATHPLFDTRLCTRQIEAAYHEMCQRHATGLAPAHLRITPVTTAADGAEIPARLT
jgi:protein O-GlcNAc transferase